MSMFLQFHRHAQVFSADLQSLITKSESPHLIYSHEWLYCLFSITVLHGVITIEMLYVIVNQLHRLHISLAFRVITNNH